MFVLLQISLLTVDNLYMSHPLLERDIYWEEHPPECLPYTKSAIGSLREPFMGSTADVRSVLKIFLELMGSDVK